MVTSVCVLMWEMMQESISSQVNGTNMFGGWMEVLFSVYHISDVLFFFGVTNYINFRERNGKKN